MKYTIIDKDSLKTLHYCLTSDEFGEFLKNNLGLHIVDSYCSKRLKNECIIYVSNLKN